MSHDPFRHQPEVDRLLQQGIEQVEAQQDTHLSGKPVIVVDLGAIRERHSLWSHHLAKVEPYYAVKCNSDPQILKLLLELGTGINCNTEEELRYVIELGFDPSRIVLTHPFKSQALLELARIRGISLLSFDTIDELEAIQKSFKDADLILRIATYEDVDGKRNPSYFGIVVEDVLQHLKAAKQLGLKIIGVSFHCEAGGDPVGAFQKSVIEAIESLPNIFKMARNFGFDPKIVDIGGSFVGQDFAEVAGAISLAISRSLPADVRFIGEPGRFMVDSSTTIGCKVLALRRSSSGRIEIPTIICTNCSVFEHFAMFITDYVEAFPEPFRLRGNYLSWNERRLQREEITVYMITGKSLFAVDEIAKQARFHHSVKVGDWICFRQMGAYSNPPSAPVGGSRYPLTFYIQ